MTIRCEIVSQDRTVFTGDVDIVVLPGAAGEMGILPEHAPVLTSLKFGIIKVRKGGKEEVFTVAGGIAEVQPDIVTVLADAAENVHGDRCCPRRCRPRPRRRSACQRCTGRYRCLPCHGSRLAKIQPASRSRPSLRQGTHPFSLFGTINPVAMFSKDLGIDLGTMFTRIADSAQVLLEEPTIVAIDVDDQKMVAAGLEARDMFGKVPDSIEVARPLRNGVIADYEITETLLQYLLQRVSGSMRIFRPRVMISVPYGVTSVERRAVYEAVMEAGSREAFLIQQPLAAAIGIDLPINSPSGNMIISLGGGCTEAAVMAMYGIVAADTLRVGGMDLG